MSSHVVLNEKTSIPLWAILVAVPTLSFALLSFGVTAWQTQANTKAIERLEASDKKQSDDFQTVMLQIKEDLAVIKTTLKERSKQ